jgi:hypothetical protein
MQMLSSLNMCNITSKFREVAIFVMFYLKQYFKQNSKTCLQRISVPDFAYLASVFHYASLLNRQLNMDFMLPTFLFYTLQRKK